MRVPDWLIFTALALTTTGCRNSIDDGDGPAMAWQESTLGQMTAQIALECKLSGKPLPRDMPAVAIIIAQDENLKKCLDATKTMILDTWETPLVMVFDKSGQPVGLASCGPNRKWEAGNGDDIVRYFTTEEPPK